MPHKYDLILLDLDGTVADTDEMIVQSMYELYDLYRHGKRSSREEIYYFSGPPIRETLKKEFPDGDIDFLVNEFVKISWSNYDKYAKLFPHVRETLINLKNKGFLLGIVTSKLRDSTIHCLEVLDLLNLVPYFVAGNDVNKMKPEPESIFKAMEHFGISAANTIVFEDADVGIEAAKRSGATVFKVEKF